MKSELATPMLHSKPNFSMPIRIYYEDTDLGGVVYHANYLKFMERARTEWLRKMGVEQDQIKNDLQTLFVVRSVQLDYLRPAKFNDLLKVTLQIKEFKRSYIIFLQQIFRQNEAGSLDLLVEGTIKIVSINTINFKPKRMPTQLLEILHEH
jgi:acyl-CoA thioester hydrolase